MGPDREPHSDKDDRGREGGAVHTSRHVPKPISDSATTARAHCIRRTYRRDADGTGTAFRGTTPASRSTRPARGQKTVAQSSLMLTTVQPLVCAFSRACSAPLV